MGKLFLLEPSGLTFNEDVTLTLPIPPGTENRDLHVGLWDDGTKSWQNLGGTVNGDFVSATLPHLSLFGLFYLGKSTVEIVNQQQLDETDLPITVVYIQGPVPPEDTADGSLFPAYRPLPEGGVRLRRGETRHPGAPPWALSLCRRLSPSTAWSPQTVCGSRFRSFLRVLTTVKWIR